MNQTFDELRRILDDWGRNFAPAEMVQNGENAQMLLEYCAAQFGVVTAGGLTHAYNALRDKLDLVPPPSAPMVKTKDELAAEENARMHRDFMESIRPQPSFDEKRKASDAKKTKEAAEKAQHDAEVTLALLIGTGKAGEPLGSLVFNRKNGFGQDLSLSGTIQAELRKVVSKINGKRDAIHTLALVRSIIAELNDYPKSGDVARTLDSINTRRAQESERPKGKDSFGNDVKKVGKLGGLL